MAWRKWLGRGLVVGLVGGLAAAYALVRTWTGPEAVRAAVLLQLHDQFPGAEASLDSASLRLLGGISLTGLRLCRRDDPTHTPFLEAPAAVLWHDKEQLAREHRIVLRKIELHQPKLRLDRGPDGRWNVEDLARPGRPEQPLPILVVHQGSVRITDRLGAGHPAVELHDLRLDLLCDPPFVAQVRAQAACDVIGHAAAAVTWNRFDGSWGLTLDLPAVPLGPALVQALARFAPAAAAQAAGLAGLAEVHADLRRPAGPAARLWHAARAHLRQGTLRHPLLPAGLADLDLTARSDDGHVTVERLSARLDGPVGGAGRLELSLDLAPDLPATADEFAAHWEGAFRSLHARVTGLDVSAELLERLPAGLRDPARPFAPTGPLDLELWLDHTGPDWARRCVLEPRGLAALYDDFPYPIEGLAGRLEQTVTSAGAKVMTVDLTGRASGQPVTITGRVEGESPTSAIRLDLAAGNLPLDERAFAAVPPSYRALARSFHATGAVDFRAHLERALGQTGFHNRFLVTFHHTAIRYDVFPYPLEDVTGVLDIATVPDAPNGLGIARAGSPPAPEEGGWCVFRNFRGRHRGAEAEIDGWNQALPNGGSLLNLGITGRHVPLDGELADALEAVDLRGPWDTLSPSGRMDFRARVVRREPAVEAPGRPADMTVGIDFLGGAAVRPAFFPYPLTDVAGHFLYKNDCIRLAGFEARHGPTKLTLADGDLRLRPEGGFWAGLTGAAVEPFTLDSDLSAALPPALRTAWEALELRGPLRLEVRRFVADVPPGPDGRPAARRPARTVARLSPPPPAAEPPPWLYWDATVHFEGASLATGLDWDGVVGQLACEGHRHNGELTLVSRLQLQQAFLFRQPVENLGANLVIDPRRPDLLQVRDLTGRLFGGELGGEALVSLGDPMGYDLKVNAAQVRLAEAARYNGLKPEVQLSGLANARLHLTGRGGGIEGLAGSGDVDVPEGRLHKLPWLINLLKVLSLSVPDQTAFEEAHASFQVAGPRVTINRLDLFGEAISLSGQGSANLLDGSDLRLNLYALWSHSVRALPWPVGELTADLSKLLFQYEVSGRVGDVKARPVPVPALVDPLREMVDKVWKRRPSSPSPPGPP